MVGLDLDSSSSLPDSRSAWLRKHSWMPEDADEYMDEAVEYIEDEVGDECELLASLRLDE